MPSTIPINQRLERLEHSLCSLSRGAQNGRYVLITGGTGTLGTALTQHFLAQGYSVTVLSRSEQRQAAYAAQFPQVRLVLADICDFDAVFAACIGQDVVVHAAALKRVDTGEEQVDEFTRVNIDGTRVVARAALSAAVGRALLISSDKAVSPINFYGLTKAVGERIWTAHNYSNSLLPTRFSAVRYGNVMGSNGSVLQIWRKQLADGLPISVRAPETTRFFMRLNDAVNLVADALFCMRGGEIFVPTTTPAFALYDLARQIAPQTNWSISPLGAREKLHEALLAPGECWQPVTEDMIAVWPQQMGDFQVPARFYSDGAPRLTGAEALRLLEA